MILRVPFLVKRKEQFPSGWNWVCRMSMDTWHWTERFKIILSAFLKCIATKSHFLLPLEEKSEFLDPVLCGRHIALIIWCVEVPDSVVLNIACKILIQVITEINTFELSLQVDLTLYSCFALTELKEITFTSWVAGKSKFRLPSYHIWFTTIFTETWFYVLSFKILIIRLLVLYSIGFPRSRFCFF